MQKGLRAICIQCKTRGMSELHPGAIIRDYRARSGLSLEGLADQIRDHGCERPSTAKLSRIETSQPIPTELLDVFEKITGTPAKELRPDLAKHFVEAAE